MSAGAGRCAGVPSARVLGGYPALGVAVELGHDDGPHAHGVLEGRRLVVRRLPDRAAQPRPAQPPPRPARRGGRPASGGITGEGHGHGAGGGGGGVCLGGYGGGGACRGRRRRRRGTRRRRSAASPQRATPPACACLPAPPSAPARHPRLPNPCRR